MHTSEFLKNRPACLQDMYCITLLSVLIVLTLFSCTNLKAQGNLMVFPRRLVFEGSKKSEDLTLVNTGKDTAKYVISIVELRMREDGSFDPITKPDSGQYFA
jgi:P pilus assembly chaperone PapD